MTEAIASAVGEQIIEKLFGVIWDLIAEPVTLPFKCKKNVEDLKKKVDDLEKRIQTAKMCKDDAEREGKMMDVEYDSWLTEARDFLEKTDKEVLKVEKENAKNKCFYKLGGLCLYALPRKELSKKAKELSECIDEHVRKASGFNLSHAHDLPPIPEVALPVTDFEEIPSRTNVLKQIMEALGSTTVNKIGVHGMPGVGKSTLVKEVKRIAEKDQLFDTVVLVEVANNKPNFNSKKVQDDIARGLGMDMLSRGLESWQVASRIEAKLTQIMGKEKILLILDDIWPKLDLKEFGIMFRKTTAGSPGEEGMKLKFLFTSRNRKVLKAEMGIQKEFSVGILEDQEAHQLFQKKVGEKCDRLGFQPIASEIIKKCGGLPLALNALANALKDENLEAWRDALEKLQNPFPDNFTSDISEQVYTAIEVSYRYLKNRKLKDIFLLSSMVGQNVAIEDLLRYSLGLGLFPQKNTIEGARDDLLGVISDLKASSLFIDGPDSKHFSIHDLICDVGRSIAHREGQGLLMDKHDPMERLDDVEALKHFKWIILKSVDRLPVGLESSQLALFHTAASNGASSLEIPTDFFQGMQRVKVVDLIAMQMPSLPSSLGFLKNLHTLCLDHSVYLEDMRILGELKSLEILSLRDLDLEEMPQEIRELSRLKLLDLSLCHRLQVIHPHVLESLLKLEELYLPSSFFQWEYGQHSILDELTGLKRLTALDVRIVDVAMIPRGLCFGDLKRYNIFIGNAGEEDNWESIYHSSKVLRLQLNTSLCFDHSIKKMRLFETAEELYLDKLIGVKNVVDELDGQGFQSLKYLHVCASSDIEEIVNSTDDDAFPVLEVLVLNNLNKLERMFRGWFTGVSLKQIKKVDVSCCNLLKNLFTSTLAERLLQLEEIRVTECTNMEEIVDDREQGSGNNDDIVELAQGEKPKFGERLRSLILQHSPKLSSFNSSSSRNEQFFDDQVVFPKLETLELSCINVNAIWHNTLETSCVNNLTVLMIERCHKLRYLFSSSMARCLVKLQKLEIRECEVMTEVICGEGVEEESGNLIFPRLEILKIILLRNLAGFYIGNNTVEFASLKELQISSCPKLKAFTLKCTSSGVGGNEFGTLFNEQVEFPSLESLIISNLKYLEMIWAERLYTTSSFCKLKSLDVWSCEKLLTIFPSSTDVLGRFWKSLEELTIINCNLLQVVFKVGEGAALVETDTQLSTLYLESLPRLKHVWDKDPQTAGLYFNKLESMEVRNCLSLKYVIPASIAKRLSQLQKLHVFNSRVEEIVAARIGGADSGNVFRIKFPQLSSLKLGNLSRLEIFCPENHSMYMPMLKKFAFYGIPGVKEKTNEQSQLNFPIQLPLFSMEKVIPNLENLSLAEDDIAMISKPQFQGDLLSKIKVLQVYGSYGKIETLRLDFLKKFCNLEKLVMHHCHVKELFTLREGQIQEPDERVEKIEALLSIRKLELVRLCCLKQICFRNTPGLLQNLESLKVLDCDSLITLSSSTTTAPFQNLTTLVVFNCNGMTNLISITIARNLVQLKSMTVMKCDVLTEIVQSKGESEAAEGLIVTFQKLRYLELQGLIRLGSFCSGKFKFKFPLLVEVIVNQCHDLTVFCGGDIDAPKLSKVRLSKEENKWRWLGDLNATMLKIHEEEVGHAKITNLKLSDDLPKLVESWNNRILQQTMDFRLLDRLEVCNVNTFQCLLTPSMALALVQLTKLKVEDCGTMEHVIMEEEADQHHIIFPKLLRIDLESCSNLKSFYRGTHCLEIPKLSSLRADGCLKMVSFVSSAFHEDEQEKPLTFFTNKVVVPMLKMLHLFDMKNLSKIWEEDQLDVDSFRQLNEVVVASCPKLQNIFPFSMLERLEKLHILRIQNCCLLEEIFESSSHLQPPTGTQPAFVFPNLTSLKLLGLFELKTFCHQAYTIECPTLGKLQVCGCKQVHILASEFSRQNSADNQLRSRDQYPLFWVNEATFPSLEELILQDNDLMTEVWQWHGQCFLELKEDEVKDNIVFPKLNTIKLHHMPKLESFSSSNLNFEFPYLESVIVMQCPRIQTFSVGKSVTPKLPSVECTEDGNQRLWKDDLNATIQEYFNKEIGYVGLTTLELSDDFPELVESWQNRTLQQKLDFGLVVRLEVCNVSNFEYLLTPSMALALVQLTYLEVKNCGTIEHVIMGEEADKHQIIFPQLSHLHLNSCSDLTSFYKGSHSLEMPVLVCFEATRCPKMASVVDSNGQEVPPSCFFTNKVVLPKLETLHLCRIKNVRKIWEEFSMLERLQRLNTLKIHHCDSLEEIFGSFSQSHDPRPTLIETSIKFVFPNLALMHLHGLSKLKSFYLPAHAVEFPSLTTLEVRTCEQVRVLAKVFSRSNGDKQLKSGDQCPLFWVNEATFPSLEKLYLGWGDAMIKMWCGDQYPGDLFPKLKYIQLSNYPEQFAKLPSVIIHSLPNLEILVVNDVFRKIRQKHAAMHFIPDTEIGLKNIRNYEIGECSKDRSANVLEESSSVTEEGSNIHDAKGEADQFENYGNDLEENNGDR